MRILFDWPRFSNSLKLLLNRFKINDIVHDMHLFIALLFALQINIKRVFGKRTNSKSNEIDDKFVSSQFLPCPSGRQVFSVKSNLSRR